MTARAVTERRNIPEILAIFENSRIPVTWATVGHLFLSSCTRSACGLAHSGMPRPRINDRWHGDWYMHDPCSNVTDAPLWYAPDLIRQIMASKIGHEIGTHTFSHINFAPERCTAALVESELRACIEIMDDFGIAPRSLVFPHNVSSYAHEGTLADLGVIAVRHRDETVRLSYPERTPHGLYKLYESLHLREARYYHYEEKAEIFMKEAIERKAAFAIWFHPSDPIDLFYRRLVPILDRIRYQQSTGQVWVATMRDLAAYCEARECLQLKVTSESNAITIRLESSLNVCRYGIPEVTLVVPAPRPPDRVAIGSAGSDLRPVAFNYSPKLAAVLVNVPVTAQTLRVTLPS
jgi:hypothetical protein